jgi:hypothetical protein
MLQELRATLVPLLRKAGMPRMHAQDVQGIACCEWDKYCRARLGEGRPKQHYPGGGDGRKFGKLTLNSGALD